MAKREDIHKKTQAKIAKILAEVPIDDREGETTFTHAFAKRTAN
jgi:hypothetical protein